MSSTNKNDKEFEAVKLFINLLIFFVGLFGNKGVLSLCSNTGFGEDKKGGWYKFGRTGIVDDIAGVDQLTVLLTTFDIFVLIDGGLY